MKKTLKVGLGVGLISGIAGIALFYLLTAIIGFHFKQLNPVSIMVVAIIVNCIGAFLYAQFIRKSSKPNVLYAIIAIGVALLLSLFDWAYPPEPHIGDVSNPIHTIVVSISIVLIPVLLKEGRSTR